MLPNSRAPTATAMLSAEGHAATSEMLAKAASACGEEAASVMPSRAAAEASAQAVEASLKAHQAVHLALAAALAATEKDKWRAGLPTSGESAGAERHPSGLVAVFSRSVRLLDHN
eukprot:1156126-Pelagomonas_calceolata.AAC.4